MDKKLSFKVQPPVFLMKSIENIKSTNYWYKIKKLLLNVKKNKYILSVLYDFLINFKTKLHNNQTAYGINKLELFSLINMIDGICNRIINAIKILKKKNIYIFDAIWCQNNIEYIVDIYIHVLYIIEKYGGNVLIYTLNCYLLVYFGLQDIYEV